MLVNENTFGLIQSGGMKKGDVLTVAQIAGVMGAKRTPDIIPMCHPILMDGINLELSLDEERLSVEIKAEVRCDGRTGVEMEALSAVSIAALTVYDMCKAVQKDMVISDIRLTIFKYPRPPHGLHLSQAHPPSSYGQYTNSSIFNPAASDNAFDLPLKSSSMPLFASGHTLNSENHRIMTGA